MEDSLHDFVLGRLDQARGTWPSIAEKTGVSIRTIQKIANRDIQDPGVSHIEKLARYFREQASA